MMKHYTEPARTIPVLGEVEVLVLGGGPAGIGAALGAARAGRRTLLIEAANAPGGMATVGMMSHWSSGTESPLVDEIMTRAGHSSSLPPGEVLNSDEPWCIAHEVLTATLLEMLSEAGVELRLHTHFSEVIMDGNRVTGAVLESKSGREAVFARVVIDATGDGDAAARAGVPYILGREEDQRCQPATLMFRIGGVDTANSIHPYAFESLVEVPAGEIQALGHEHLSRPAGHVLLYRTRLPGEVCVNMTNVTSVDGTSVADLTQAELVCRRQIDEIIRFLRRFAPGYEKCYLVAAGGRVGIRETRHFRGLYTITDEDILEGRVFEDWIATRNYFNFDIHNVHGPGLDEHGAQFHFQARGAYTIPYRACVPESIDGLLVAGRCISGTHRAHSNYRVMPICCNIGFGLAVAAATPVAAGVPVRAVNLKEVQQSLNRFGIRV